ncbi:hypothetical protein STEG23_027244, partial [Scotinomys teguina]
MKSVSLRSTLKGIYELSIAAICLLMEPEKQSEMGAENKESFDVVYYLETVAKQIAFQKQKKVNKECKHSICRYAYGYLWYICSLLFTPEPSS